MAEASAPLTERYNVHSLELGLSILESFDRDAIEAMTLSEMARRIGISRSSAFRLVHTLQRLGYLESEGESKTYRLGSRVMSLGYSFLASKDIAELARPELQQLRVRTRCSTHLGILEGREVIYIARHAAYKPVSATIAVGARLPAHATSMGRIMLAFSSATYVRHQFADAKLAKFSERTPTTFAELEALLDGDRRRGYVISHSSFESGVASVAAPLFNARNEIAGAINVSAPEGAIPNELFDHDIREAVCASARRISQLLGQRPASIPA